MPPVPQQMSEANPLALNVFDMNEAGEEICYKLFGGRIDTDAIHNVGDDELAIGFTCSTVTAALACDILRSEDRKRNRNLSRIYLRVGKGWKRIPSTIGLTIIDKGVTKLNPDLFADETPQGPQIPLPPVKMVY